MTCNPNRQGPRPAVPEDVKAEALRVFLETLRMAEL